MNLEMLRDEYDQARRYTHSLYADLSEADVQWRPAPKSSGIGWHLGHQAAINHFLLRN
ncbi:MAG TPA: DinB family protein, partial [Candidatus Tectomicrobia bacterium]